MDILLSDGFVASDGMGQGDASYGTDTNPGQGPKSQGLKGPKGPKGHHVLFAFVEHISGLSVKQRHSF